MSGPVKRARLQLASPEWLDALPLSVEGVEGGAWLRLNRPAPLEVRVWLQPIEKGVIIERVEGALTHLYARVVAVNKQLRVDVDIGFPVSVPGPLLRSLEQVIVPSWTRAVAESLSR